MGAQEVFSSEQLRDDDVENCNPQDNRQSPLGPFHDPVFKKLAVLNGEINRMRKPEVQSKLSELRLCSMGNKDVLKKRLKSYYKQLYLNVSKKDAYPPRYYHFYIIIDFEATCDERKDSDFPHEIIEFPAVLLDTEKKEIVDEFQVYCKPKVRPELTDFCKDLTGISQEQVDKADEFPVVLQKFEHWMEMHELGTRYKYAIVTDGPWDMSKFLLDQCKMSGIPYPDFARKWINIRKSFGNFYNYGRCSLQTMLQHLDFTFYGRPHCGLDDSRNIARITTRMLEDGANLRVNERIHLTNNRREKSVMPISTREFKNMRISKSSAN